MNLFKLSFLGLIFVGLLSCSEDDTTAILASNFYGTWDVESITIDGEPSERSDDACAIENEYITINENMTFSWNSSYNDSYYDTKISSEISEPMLDCDNELDSGSWTFEDGKLQVTLNNVQISKQETLEIEDESDYSFSYKNGKVILTEDLYLYEASAKIEGEPTSKKVTTYVKREDK